MLTSYFNVLNSKFCYRDMKQSIRYFLSLLMLTALGCKKIVLVNISTDKAVYNPGDVVSFTIDDDLPATTRIRFRHLDQTVKQLPYSSRTWTWKTPSTDFTGYLVDLYSVDKGVEIIHGSIGVDVSSDWTTFPRYGFLSDFSQLSNSQMDDVIKNLSRYHINGLQFYDWSEKHHKPLAGTVSSPADNWLDIASRSTYKSTVQGYITRAHEAGMKAMSYNLCYGALNDAASDGVQNTWYMYTDVTHTSKKDFPLGAPFKSSIYLLDPSNSAWQQYIAARNMDMYAVYNFDGYHIDQLGDQGTLYNYNGGIINVANSFHPFIESMKKINPDKRLVFNAVNQFGQQGSIATAPVDFLYTEVWDNNYSDLSKIIIDNNSYSTKKTVLAAYMNAGKSGSAGTFNTPSVLYTDAVIFAFGGAHIELGEHMLGNLYFPNGNLQMPDDLKSSIVNYYDFSVAYQNLLRSGGVFNNPIISVSNNAYGISNWPPQLPPPVGPLQSKIYIVGKQVGSKQVLHLLNFSNNNTLDWNDPNGIKPPPTTTTGLKLSYTTTQPVSKIWFASPDINFGVARNLTFQRSGNIVTFEIPWLKYWDMIVIE